VEFITEEVGTTGTGSEGKGDVEVGVGVKVTVGGEETVLDWSTDGGRERWEKSSGRSRW